MTTTNDGGIHPMVMKAARALAKSQGCSPDFFPAFVEQYVEQAKATLTECGALECLNALNSLSRHVERMREAGLVSCDDTGPESFASEAIAKVYGSAP